MLPSSVINQVAGLLEGSMTPGYTACYVRALLLSGKRLLYCKQINSAIHMFHANDLLWIHRAANHNYCSTRNSNNEICFQIRKYSCTQCMSIWCSLLVSSCVAAINIHILFTVPMKPLLPHIHESFNGRLYSIVIAHCPCFFFM